MNRSSIQSGFTLIEVLVGITILAIGIMAVVSMMVSSIQGNAFSRGMTEATAVGQWKMEELMGLPYNHEDLQPIGEEHGPLTLPQSLDRYEVRWMVRENVTLQNTKDIEVVVRWEEKNSQKNVTLRTVRANLE